MKKHPVYIRESELLRAGNEMNPMDQGGQHAKPVTIREKLAFPSFRSPDLMADREISEALKQLNRMLLLHGIRATTILPVDDRTLYTFITGELMEQPAGNSHVAGVMKSYIYEDYHPNHENDISVKVYDTVRTILSKVHDSEVCQCMPSIENWPALRHFRQSFENFIIHHLNIEKLSHNGNKADVVFSIKFSGLTPGPARAIVFCGNGRAYLYNSEATWHVARLELPG